MRTTNGIWVVEIGHHGLQALWCSGPGDSHVVVADAWDEVELGETLSGLGSKSGGVVCKKVEELQRRHGVQADRVAISVPGTWGTVHFFDGPPTTLRKLADITKYEVKLAIPYDLKEAVRDWQITPGALETDNFFVAPQVCWAAMERQQVDRFVQPFRQTGLDVSVLQVTPLCIYNFVSHHLASQEPTRDFYDPFDPPQPYVIVHSEAETADLLITDGFRIWQHSVLPAKVDWANDLSESVGRLRNPRLAGLILLGDRANHSMLKSFFADEFDCQTIDPNAAEWSSWIVEPGKSEFTGNLADFAVTFGLCLQALGRSELDISLVRKTRSALGTVSKACGRFWRRLAD